MDRELLEISLAEAERHVAMGEHHLARQREIITELEHDSYDTGQATQLLRRFEELHGLHIAARNRLRQQLGLSRRQC